MREELSDLKRHIYEDGSISDGEVKLLKDVFARYGLGEDEAGLLLDLNTVLSGEDHAASFEALFIDSLVAYLSEGERWDWLRSRLLKDGTVDALERRMLAACRDKGLALPADLAGFV
ncbi:hypothetical protein [Magnetospirillum sp. UT-4]|uniref:hypothetical protein n=1 Tax=Magnetospirillum sp. UT-4 TaxID=2681467 RepID=UPI00137C7D39|nr:hypothetical protein [Magnetospirillum sp. UT-4]CAA7615257.1 conserved hypothetical protein [Magnetospirillum sp. UT-4]